MKANLEAETLRRKCGLSGQANVVEIAHMLGLEAYERAMPPDELHEVIVKNNIAVAEQLDRPAQRWAVAHGIGHFIMHSHLNNIWLRANSGLADKLEREGEDFAFHLLVDKDEALNEGLGTVQEVATYFGVPAGFLAVQRRVI